MKRSYKKILATLILTLIVVSIIGVSYAVYKTNKENAEATLVLTDENFSINYLDGKIFDVKELLPGDTIAKKYQLRMFLIMIHI